MFGLLWTSDFILRRLEKAKKKMKKKTICNVIMLLS